MVQAPGGITENREPGLALHSSVVWVPCEPGFGGRAVCVCVCSQTRGTGPRGAAHPLLLATPVPIAGTWSSRPVQCHKKTRQSKLVFFRGACSFQIPPPPNPG